MASCDSSTFLTFRKSRQSACDPEGGPICSGVGCGLISREQRSNVQYALDLPESQATVQVMMPLSDGIPLSTSTHYETLLP